ncbi:MAG: hypothetical protein JWQ96_3248 [Segetibacter sp.]|nr:hypothetical protein [Segetibacter sp.]
MQTITRILIIVVLLSTAACKKSSSTKNDGLAGKWRLSETFNGYTNGGDFAWHPVSLDYSEIIEFTSTNQYFKNTLSQTSMQNCIGSYQLLPDNVLNINSSCHAATETAQITELTSTNLILNRQVREGYIHYKYTREH